MKDTAKHDTTSLFFLWINGKQELPSFKQDLDVSEQRRCAVNAREGGIVIHKRRRQSEVEKHVKLDCNWRVQYSS